MTDTYKIALDQLWGAISQANKALGAVQDRVRKLNRLSDSALWGVSASAGAMLIAAGAVSLFSLTPMILPLSVCVGAPTGLLYGRHRVRVRRAQGAPLSLLEEKREQLYFNREVSDLIEERLANPKLTKSQRDRLLQLRDTLDDDIVDLTITRFPITIDANSAIKQLPSP